MPTRHPDELLARLRPARDHEGVRRVDLHDLRWMPHVRHLIEDQGLSFRNSFSTYPLCAPARASLITGQYAHKLGLGFYKFGAQAAWQPMTNEQRVGWSLSDSEIWCGIDDDGGMAQPGTGGTRRSSPS